MSKQKLSKPPTKVTLRILTIWLQKVVRLNKSLAPFADSILSKNIGLSYGYLNFNPLKIFQST